MSNLKVPLPTDRAVFSFIGWLSGIGVYLIVEEARSWVGISGHRIIDRYAITAEWTPLEHDGKMWIFENSIELLEWFGKIGAELDTIQSALSKQNPKLGPTTPQYQQSTLQTQDGRELTEQIRRRQRS